MPKPSPVEALTEENKRLRAQLWEIHGSTLLVFPEQWTRDLKVQAECRRLFEIATRNLREDETI